MKEFEKILGQVQEIKDKMQSGEVVPQETNETISEKI